MSEIVVQGLRHTYSVGTPFEKVAIDNISVTIPQGQLVGIIGHTGSGKSTFIQHLNALYAPTEGRVTVGGVDINATKLTRRDVKRQVGMVFQYPEYQLFEETVYREIAFGPRNMGWSDGEIDSAVRDAAAFTGIPQEMLEESPLEQSGGWKRRIAIAGVIAMRPEVLILDEPTAGLDPAGCEGIMENIRDYREKTGATVIIVSHDMDEMARTAQRLLVFHRGSIVMDGTPEEIFSHSERLREMGLDVPHSTRIADELRRRGIALPGNICTHEALLSAVLRYKEAEKC